MARNDTTEQMFNVECCSGQGHTIKDGGSHINITVLNKKAFSGFLSAYDLWLDKKERFPRASALMCDRCMEAGKEPRFAVGKDSDEGPIYRLPVEELEDWQYEEVQSAN